MQDHRVREISELCLHLRSGLRLTPQFESGEKCYLVEDVPRSQFYRIGISEYLLISMFDGKTSVGEAVVRLNRIKGRYQISEAEATAVCKWLVDSELAHTTASADGHRLAKNAVDRASAKRLSAWNPLCTKVPLAYPDRLVAKITPWFRFCFGKTAAAMLLAVGILAMYQLSNQWDSFASASNSIFTPSRWIWLLASWLVLKILHEAAHAIVCRKYGGAVHEAGAIFVLFAPLAYVDLTCSWRFRSKWRRIHTAAAGMYLELWIAAIAAITWVATDPGQLNDVCFNLVIMASLTTLVFNANPLMRFDGYYILSDLLEIPNLYSQGQQYLQYLGRRYVLGEEVQSSLSWSARDLFTRVYGFAAFAWRIVICVTLVIAASLLFNGLGLLLAITAVLMWVGIPILKLVRYVSRPDGMQALRRRRLAFALCTTVAFGGLFFGIAPWPIAKRAAAVVQYEPLVYVRVSSPGFVQSIHAESGQPVQAGQVIAKLQNRQLIAEHRDLEIAIEQSKIKSRVFKQTDEIHSYQSEVEQLRSLHEKLEEKRVQVERLTVRAPAAGILVSRELQQRVGTYLQEGNEIALIGDESRKRLRIAVDHNEHDPFALQVGHSVQVRFSGGVKFTSTLKELDPRATKRAPEESMYAAFGGPLPSKAVDPAESDQAFELLTPHFAGVVALPSVQSRRLRVGQNGVIWFGRNQETIGQILQQKLRQHLPSQLQISAFFSFTLPSGESGSPARKGLHPQLR